jgi:hypothetical protein
MILLLCPSLRTAGSGGGTGASGAALSFRRGGVGCQARCRASGVKDGAGTGRRRGAGGSRSGPRQALDAPGFYGYSMLDCDLYRGNLFGVGRPNVADTKDQYFLCRLSVYSQHL